MALGTLRVVALGVLLGAGVSCVGSQSEMCEFGLICPSGMVCSAAREGVCVFPEQIQACASRDATLCSYPGVEQGYCDQGVCFGPVCGNNRLEIGEACDQGDTVDGDGCSADCTSDETCGNGVVDPVNDELCDRGSANSDEPDSDCRTDCRPGRCGDGIPDAGEECDLGLLNSDTEPNACRLSCALAFCGDGVVDASEVCDPQAVPSSPCSVDCLSDLSCGNAVLDPGEECDAGGWNADAPNAPCRVDCHLPRCGDSIVDDAAGELCDHGPGNSDSVPDACRSNCRPADCGDRVIDTDEVCDDGNASSFDGCDATCQLEYGWNCSPGNPSVCTACPAYRYGAACDHCGVLVDVHSPALSGDGTSWPTAFSSVQEGIDVAAAQPIHCEVWIAQGVYYIYQTSRSNTIQLQSGVTILGGFAGGETHADQRDPTRYEAVLDGSDGLNSLFVYQVVTARQTWDATIDGLTITGGRAYVPPPSVPLGESSRGGGLYVTESDLGVIRSVLRRNTAPAGGGLYLVNSTVRVLDTTFFGNSSTSYGGGVMVDPGGDLRVTGSLFARNIAHFGGGLGNNRGLQVLVGDSRFFGNWASSEGGAVHSHSSDVWLEHAVFVDNTAERGGGAVHNQESMIDISECVFALNACGGGNNSSGGGAVGGVGGAVAITNSVLVGNAARDGGTSGRGGGGGCYIRSAPWLVTNSVLVGNYADGAGGGLQFNSASGSLVSHCTFVGNETRSRGGALAKMYSSTSLVVSNSILWANHADSEPGIYGNPVVCHSDVQGLAPYPGTANQRVEPRFVGDAATPLHSGTWTSVALDTETYQTVLSDANADFVPGELVGAFVHAEMGIPPPDERLQRPWWIIVDNTEHEVWVWGDLSRYPFGGYHYDILDFRLSSDSSAIDAGFGCADPGGCTNPCEMPQTPAVDLEGVPRYDAGWSSAHGGAGDPPYVDLGAYEYHP